MSALGASVGVNAIDLLETVPRAQPLWEFVRASGLRSLVICDSKNPNAKYTVLLVEPDTGRPQLAAKVATTDAAGRAVDAERRVLRDLEASWPRLAGVPRIVGSVDFEGRPGIVMTAVAGVPMRRAYLGWRHTARRSNVAADFATVERWVTEFQRTTAQGWAPLDMDTGVTSRLTERYADYDGVDGCVETFGEICTRLREHRTARTAVHGDLWAANVLLAGGNVSGIVDWEAATRSGEPARDLIRFAHMYALFLDRRTRSGRRVPGHRVLRAGDWGAAVTYALEGTGWFPELFRQFLERNLVRLGAPASIWRDLALAGIAEVAALADNGEYARLHLDLFHRLTSRPPHRQPGAEQTR